MNGSLVANESLLQALKKGIAVDSRAQVAVCVPFPYLAQVQVSLRASGIDWGAQDVSEHAQGAYTGDVAASMLREFGCRYVIVGHSERRAIHGESDELVARKAKAVLAEGLVPVVCVGETLSERDEGQTMVVVKRQLAAVVGQLGVGGLSRMVLAYEPVWAIGTGRTATPAQAQEVHEALRAAVADVDSAVASTMLMLYGGSMKAANAADLLAAPDVDGGLIGGASLVPDDFLAICTAACVR